MRVSPAVLIAIGLCACSDTALAPPPSSQSPGAARHFVAGDPGVTFDVTGFTYGGDGQEVSPPRCAKETVVSTDSTVKTSGAVVIGSMKFASECGINSNPGGDPYDGGTISIGGWDPTDNYALGSVDASWDKIRTITHFPSDGTVILTPFPISVSGCTGSMTCTNCSGVTFISWIIDNNFSNPILTNPLVISASALANHRIQGQFQCAPRSGTTGGGGGGGGNICDDPSSPGCASNDD